MVELDNAEENVQAPETMQAHGSLSVSTTIVQQKAKKSRPMKYYNDFGKAWLGDVGQRNKYLV